MKIKYWLSASRLHTLPLSFSGILVSSLISIARGYSPGLIFFMTILTSLFLQVFANMANDYGDGIQGIDNRFRIGPKRTIQAGVIAPDSMKIVLFFLGTICFISGMILIYSSFQHYFAPIPILFLLLLLACIYAAIKYTFGKNAYGYKGWGDLSVLLFFGFLSVQGNYFLYTHRFDLDMLYLAAGIGCFSMSMLNINNIRDMSNDRATGKNTFVVQIGLHYAKIYHLILVLCPFIFASCFVSMNHQYRSYYQWIFLILLIPIFFHIKKILFIKDLRKMNIEIKKISCITFLYSLIIGITQLL